VKINTFNIFCTLLILASACKGRSKNPNASAIAIAPVPSGNSAESANGNDKSQNGSLGSNGQTEEEQLGLMCTPGGTYSYVGLGGVKLEVGRARSAVNRDRHQVKSLNVLRDSYRQSFGVLPPSFTRYTATFSVKEPRWLSPTMPSAFSNYALFVMGREVGQAVIRGDASWAKRTGDEEIAEGCKLIAAKAWIRTISDEESQSCATYLSRPEFAELSAEDRWSYVFAAMLTSVEFITY